MVRDLEYAYTNLLATVPWSIQPEAEGQNVDRFAYSWAAADPPVTFQVSRPPSRVGTVEGDFLADRYWRVNTLLIVDAVGQSFEFTNDFACPTR